MKIFKDKVAVVTGAASGIGRAIAHCCARENMKVVLADVEEEGLSRSEGELKSAGAAVKAWITDVSKWDQVEALARRAVQAFGEVHLLFNNAGVVGDLVPIWKNPLAEWEWVLGVNLWGVIHGIRAFVPLMLEQDNEAHVVNTASMAGLIYGPGGVYSVSKHAVVGLSEALYQDLSRRGSKVKVSAFCPGFVSTRIMDSDRNRPFQRTGGTREPEAYQRREQRMRQSVRQGMPPERAAEILMAGIREERFYIFTHPDMKDLVKARMETILGEASPIL